MTLAGRVGATVVVLVIAVASAATIRAALASRQELADANRAMASGRVSQAIAHYRRAIRWSAPFSPHPDRAIRALEDIALRLESEGEIEAALSAWRAISGGSSATRTTWTRNDPVRVRANQQIARLLAAHGRVPIDAGLEDQALEASHRALLRSEVRADPFWGSLLLLGFAVWVSGLISLIAYGFDKTGQATWPGARAPLTVTLIGLVSFFLGLLLA